MTSWERAAPYMSMNLKTAFLPQRRGDTEKITEFCQIVSNPVLVKRNIYLRVSGALWKMFFLTEYSPVTFSEMLLL